MNPPLWSYEMVELKVGADRAAIGPDPTVRS
jgi:hypothetical protein